MAYLEEAMPLAVYTDMFNTIVLRRAGLALGGGEAGVVGFVQGDSHASSIVGIILCMHNPWQSQTKRH